MSEPGWAFVGGGNIASPKVIPEYYVPDEDKSVSQRTKSKNAEGESWSPVNSSGAQLTLRGQPCASGGHDKRAGVKRRDKQFRPLAPGAANECLR